MLLPPLVPSVDPSFEDFEMFRIGHCRVTSLSSGMLRMRLEGHAVCDRPRPVNAQLPSASQVDARLVSRLMIASHIIPRYYLEQFAEKQKPSAKTGHLWVYPVEGNPRRGTAQ